MIYKRGTRTFDENGAEILPQEIPVVVAEEAVEPLSIPVTEEVGAAQDEVDAPLEEATLPTPKTRKKPGLRPKTA